MNKKEINEIIADKLEHLTLKTNTKTIWLLPYTNSEYEPSCDIAETQEDLEYYIKANEKYGTEYRIIKVEIGK